MTFLTFTIPNHLETMNPIQIFSLSINSADLEAAAKARNKISISKSGDAKTISRLHDTLLDLDGFLSSNTLSVIVERLQTCATLHSKAVEFQNGLDGVEQNVSDTEGIIRNLEENLDRMEKGMVKNMEIIQKNMDDLDGRLKATLTK